MPLVRALLLEEQWTHKILHEGKTWELRAGRCDIRERIGLVATSKTSCSGKRMLHGEVDVVDCFEVAQIRPIQQPSGRVIGLKFLPPPNHHDRFLWLPSNCHRHKLFCDLVCWDGATILPGRQHLKLFGSKARSLYAWVLENPKAYPKAKVLKSVRKNQVRWVKL